MFAYLLDEILNTESEKSASALKTIKEYYSDDENRIPKELVTEKFIKEENQKIENEIIKEKKRKPRNLLFVTGYSSEEDLNTDEEK